MLTSGASFPWSKPPLAQAIRSTNARFSTNSSRWLWSVPRRSPGDGFEGGRAESGSLRSGFHHPSPGASPSNPQARITTAGVLCNLNSSVIWHAHRWRHRHRQFLWHWHAVAQSANPRFGVARGGGWVRLAESGRVCPCASVLSV